MGHTRVEVTVWEQAEFRLLAQPVTALDGTVYRWEAVRRPGRCPCTWAVMCPATKAPDAPPLCETWIEQELTGEGWGWVNEAEEREGDDDGVQLSRYCQA